MLSFEKAHGTVPRKSRTKSSRANRHASRLQMEPLDLARCWPGMVS